jgi:hypothetical protein
MKFIRRASIGRVATDIELMHGRTDGWIGRRTWLGAILNTHLTCESWALAQHGTAGTHLAYMARSEGVWRFFPI